MVEYIDKILGNPIIQIVIVLWLVIGMRAHGHSGLRGILAKKYKVNTNKDYNCKSKTVYFREKEKWVPEGIGGINCSNEGLLISQPRLIRFFFPSLLIPWQDIELCGEVEHRLFNYIQIKLQGFDDPIILVSSACKENIEKYLKR